MDLNLTASPYDPEAWAWSQCGSNPSSPSNSSTFNPYTGACAITDCNNVGGCYAGNLFSTLDKAVPAGACGYGYKGTEFDFCSSAKSHPGSLWTYQTTSYCFAKNNTVPVYIAYKDITAFLEAFYANPPFPKHWATFPEGCTCDSTAPSKSAKRRFHAGM